jgi:O-antigen ligase
MPRGYLWLSGLAMASGSVLLLEPAPYDLALALLLVAGVLLNRLRFHASHRLPLLLLAGFLAANAASLLAAPDIRRALTHSAINFYMVASWLFFAGLTSAYGCRAVSVLMRGYAFAGSLAVALSTLAFFGLIPNQSLLLGSGRARGLFKDPNVYGPYLVLMFLYALARLQRNGLRGRGFPMGLAVCAISALGVFLSFSRAAWINCAVVIVCFIGFQTVSGIRARKLSAGPLYAMLLVALLAGGIWAASASDNSPVGRMLAFRLSRNGLQNYDSMRFYTQRLALETAMAKPLGIGPGQSEVVFAYATHNMYLRVLAENGVLGFAALYGFVALSLLRAVKGATTLADGWRRDLFAVVGACLVGTLVNGLVIDTIHWRHLWFLLGLAWWVPRPTGSHGEEEA